MGILSDNPSVTLKTSRGIIEIDTKDVIHFPEGILGFEGYNDFAILDITDCKPFKSMLSVKEGGPDFVVVEPLLIFDDYTPLDSAGPIHDLGLGDPLNLVILSIVTLSEKTEDITINLSGPIFLNQATGLAKQVALPDEKYHTKVPVFIDDEN
ncbi:MAG: flagellar assembly protein FliW [Candidatus Latescibacteria bacterium]|nr:flagellar assembly protein FliW [Candidatus Latescibacterota bacterium]